MKADSSTAFESNRAAKETLKIILKLKNANLLHNPHTIWSPLAIFIAGIEIEDEIYQDWILDLLAGFLTWGSNVGKVRDVLKEIWSRRRADSRHVEITSVMRDHGLTLIA